MGESFFRIWTPTMASIFRQQKGVIALKERHPLIRTNLGYLVNHGDNRDLPGARLYYSDPSVLVIPSSCPPEGQNAFWPSLR